MFSRDSKARRRIEELEDTIARVQRDFKALEMEWASAYDKLRSMMQRVAKRAEVAENLQRREEPLGDATITETTAGSASPTLTHLTARQKQIQLSIMRRRANGGQQ